MGKYNNSAKISLNGFDGLTAFQLVILKPNPNPNNPKIPFSPSEFLVSSLAPGCASVSTQLSPKL